VARHFPRRLQELLGYRIHRPNLGGYEGQDPWLMQGPVLDLLGPLASSALHEYRELMAGDGEPAAQDDLPPHGFHTSDERFFRLASPACDQSAGSSHNRPGHRCGCQKDERRSRQAAVELA
jgi:hypothetical protein